MLSWVRCQLRGVLRNGIFCCVTIKNGIQHSSITYLTYLTSNYCMLPMQRHVPLLGCDQAFHAISFISAIGPIESPALTVKLTDSEQQNLEFRIKTDLDKLQKKFATLQTSVRKSLKEREVPTQDVIAHVIGFGVSDEHKKELTALNSFDRVFVILTDYWSFLDCDLLENIVENYGCDADQDKILKYQEELNLFCKRRVSEVPNKSLVLSSDQTRERMIVKLNISDPRLAVIKDLKIKLCKILSIEPWSLQIMEIKEGCVLITFLISVHVSKCLYSKSLTEAYCEDLKNLSVLTITYSNSDCFKKVFPVSCM